MLSEGTVHSKTECACYLYGTVQLNVIEWVMPRHQHWSWHQHIWKEDDLFMHVNVMTVSTNTVVFQILV